MSSGDGLPRGTADLYLSHREAAAQDATLGEVLAFWIGPFPCALELKWVRQILPASQLTVPPASLFPTSSSPQYGLLLENGQGVFVERIEGVFSVRQSQVRPFSRYFRQKSYILGALCLAEEKLFFVYRL